jgi:uncharacterized protein with LGFP repeats
MALDANRVIVMAGDYLHDYTDHYKNNAAPLMGYPTTNPFSCGSARMVVLDGGEQSPGAMITDAGNHHYVCLPRVTWERYRSLGGPLGRLGVPIDSVEPSGTTTVQRFEHGTITVRDGRALTDLELAGTQERPLADMSVCMR